MVMGAHGVCREQVFGNYFGDKQLETIRSSPTDQVFILQGRLSLAEMNCTWILVYFVTLFHLLDIELTKLVV